MALYRRFATVETSSNNESSLENDDKGRKLSFGSTQYVKLFAILLLISVIGSTIYDSEKTKATVVSKPDTKQALTKSKIENLRANEIEKYSSCTIAFKPPPARNEADWRQPLWLPSMPGFGSGQLMKNLVDSLTGLNSGTKNYHASIKNRLKRCKGISETVVCTQAHPMVGTSPEKRTKQFQPPVIMAVRNFVTHFPSSHTYKAISYHGATSQVAEDEWREARDQYWEQAFQEWKKMFMWWKTADYYKVALYVPFEKLVDAEAGPPLVQKLADQLKEAGFEVASSEDISCIWFKTVEEELKRQEEVFNYEAGYTEVQKDLLLQQLHQFIEEVQDDRELVALLKEYHTYVRDNLRIDG